MPRTGDGGVVLVERRIVRVFLVSRIIGIRVRGEQRERRRQVAKTIVGERGLSDTDREIDRTVALAGVEPGQDFGELWIGPYGFEQRTGRARDARKRTIVVKIHQTAQRIRDHAQVAILTRRAGNAALGAERVFVERARIRERDGLIGEDGVKGADQIFAPPTERFDPGDLIGTVRALRFDRDGVSVFVEGRAGQRREARLVDPVGVLPERITMAKGVE